MLLSLLVRITGDYVTGTNIVICCWREYCDMPPNVLVHSHKTIAISMTAMCRLPLDDRLFFIAYACLPFQRAALRRVGPPYSTFSSNWGSKPVPQKIIVEALSDF